jgi:hypothetical protein
LALVTTDLSDLHETAIRQTTLAKNAVLIAVVLNVGILTLK